MTLPTPFSAVRRVLPVGPRAFAQRTGLAAVLALAGLTGVAVGYAPAATAAPRVEQVVQADVQALSITSWSAKVQREGHGLADATLLTEVYRRLAAPTILGRSRLDQETSEWLLVRAQWRQRLEQPIGAGQAQAVVRAFNADIVGRCGCGSDGVPSANILNTLGFATVDWESLVQLQRVAHIPNSWGELDQINQEQSSVAWRWDGRTPRASAPASPAERQHAQARLDAHAHNLNVSWVRLPWGTFDDMGRAQAVERGLIGLHTAMQHITTWNEPAVGMKGRLRWDMSLYPGAADSNVRVDNGSVWMQAPIHEFAARWFDAVQIIEPVAPRIERHNDRQRSRFVSDNALASLLTAVVDGRGDRAVDRMANRALRAAPGALIGRGGSSRRPTGEALASIDSASFSNDMHAIAPDLFALSGAPQPRGTRLSREDWAVSLDSVRTGLSRLDKNDYAPSCQGQRMR